MRKLAGQLFSAYVMLNSFIAGGETLTTYKRASTTTGSVGETLVQDTLEDVGLENVLNSYTRRLIVVGMIGPGMVSGMCIGEFFAKRPKFDLQDPRSASFRNSQTKLPAIL